MRKTREILRLKWLLERSHRETARSLGVGTGTVALTVHRAGQVGLDWSQVQALSDEALEERLYGERAERQSARPRPDCVYIHTERRKPSVTLELLHLEYLEKHPDGYRYTQFCEAYRQWLRKRGVTMRQVHRAGEKMFVDYAGKKPSLVDPQTGEVTPVELFIAVLGASNYTFAEATRTQRSPEWIASHTRAIEYFGGVAGAVVPDQLRSGVSRSCRYEPGVQRTYREWATHYGTTILPARPARPRDKAKVEVAVQVVERWILARLRNETFFSLDVLNGRIAELLEELNARPMRLYKASRSELFDQLDRSALRPLPPDRFVYAEWKRARVNIDYHVQLDHHFYSVPYTLVREEVEVRSTTTTVEIFLRGQRVASHKRSYSAGRHTTISEHMPKSHQKHLEWSPTRLVHWAETVGPSVAKLVSAILQDRPHPEQGYRSCLGILRLGKRYGHERLDAACSRAVAVGARSYRHVDSILKNGLDRQPLPKSVPAQELAPTVHPNIRGRDYYH